MSSPSFPQYRQLHIRSARTGGDPPAPPTVPSIPAKLSEEDARIAVSEADGPGLRRPREERGRARERKRRVASRREDLQPPAVEASRLFDFNMPIAAFLFNVIVFGCTTSKEKLPNNFVDHPQLDEISMVVHS